MVLLARLAVDRREHGKGLDALRLEVLYKAVAAGGAAAARSRLLMA